MYLLYIVLKEVQVLLVYLERNLSFRWGFCPSLQIFQILSMVLMTEHSFYNKLLPIICMARMYARYSRGKIAF
jgi:hypothetical protein